MTRREIGLGITAVMLVATGVITPLGQQPPNVILFVVDGMRSGMVTPANAPALAALAAEGVTFTNSHSMYPTFTMPNAAALATGHYIGDTGVFGNSIFVGRPVTASAGSTMPQIENDNVLGELDTLFGGTFIPEATLLETARGAGFSTAAMGKLGPTLLQDHRARGGDTTVIVDDGTGSANGVPLSREMTEAIAAAGLPARPPARGENARSGDFRTPGTTTANVVQQTWLGDVATRVVLPLFKQRGKPFVMVYWSRDPDASQHNHGDSFGTVVPGINGPTVLAGIRNADANLRRLREALVSLDLAATTSIVVAADHGFATISKESATSPAAKRKYADVMEGMLPVGFLALDLAQTLGLPVWEPSRPDAPLAAGAHPRGGSALIGTSAASPDVMVVANGGSDLIYMPGANAAALAPKVVAALMAQDYVSGIFTDERLGKIAGTLPLGAINLVGSATMPRPAMVVNFRSFASGCSVPTTCTVSVADVALQQGQGFHGGFSRGETFNFMAAAGPAFKSGFVNRMPVGNADVAPTIAAILRLPMPSRGRLAGRVLSEALKNGRERSFRVRTLRSEPGPGGLRTVLEYQETGGMRYFDAGGFPGRTLGLKEPVR